MKENRRISENMEPTFPQDDIICKTCAFKKAGIIGYKNGYCEMYAEPPGKPNAILFEHGKCQYYYAKKDSP